MSNFCLSSSPPQSLTVKETPESTENFSIEKFLEHLYILRKGRKGF